MLEKVYIYHTRRCECAAGRCLVQMFVFWKQIHGLQSGKMALVIVILQILQEKQLPCKHPDSENYGGVLENVLNGSIHISNICTYPFSINGAPSRAHVCFFSCEGTEEAASVLMRDITGQFSPCVSPDWIIVDPEKTALFLSFTFTILLFIINIFPRNRRLFHFSFWTHEKCSFNMTYRFFFSFIFFYLQPVVSCTCSLN